jgi:hypothetical protein
MASQHLWAFFNPQEAHPTYTEVPEGAATLTAVVAARSSNAVLGCVCYAAGCSLQPAV